MFNHKLLLFFVFVSKIVKMCKKSKLPITKLKRTQAVGGY